MKNGVHLITYPDSLGINLLELHYVLKRYLKNAISGVHILPFYPSSADRGFSPITYSEVDHPFGDWEDINHIGKDHDLMVDFMANHISRQSEYFKDFLQNAEKSEFYDMFLPFSKFDKEISKEDLEKVYTRKPRPPYLSIERPDGSKDKVWCTFDYEQIDVDITSDICKKVFRNFLIQLCRRGIKTIRLDAFAYTTKKLGTNCFFLEPQVWEILDWVKKFVEPFDVEILPEIHEHYSIQKRIAEKGYLVYDFSLPMLVLYSLYSGKSHRLKHWLEICPRNQVTTLDTHDGIGVVDVVDLLTEEEIEETKNNLFEKGGSAKKIYSGKEYKNLDIYQINCTYYSALGESDNAYILARALQFFTPGIPQVYYVGLLAGKNDNELLNKTKNGRDINRHYYDLNEIENEMEREVVKRLIRLITFRNNYQAFSGNFNILESKEENIIKLSWENNEYKAVLTADLLNHVGEIKYYDRESLQWVDYKI